jgi:outer membrane lipoprotein-sorting protein
MRHHFGPWATAMPDRSSPQLSTFWRQRLTRLASAAQNDPPGRLIGTLVAILAAAIVPIPTFCGKAVSAQAEQAKAVQVTSYVCTSIVHVHEAVDQHGKPVAPQERKGTTYWLAPGAIRSECNSLDKPGETGLRIVMICPGKGRQSIDIDHENRTYLYSLPCLQKTPLLEQPEAWSELAKSADKDLGTRTIHGKKAYGFEIDLQKVDPRPNVTGRIEIWLDAETHLPIQASGSMKAATLGNERGVSGSFEIGDFRWNEPLARELFDPKPPPGYVDATPDPAEKANDICQALKAYADRNGGRYPAWEEFDAAALIELGKTFGVAVTVPEQGIQIKLHDPQSALAFQMAAKGLSQAYALKQTNDAVYYGKTVSPTDKDKVLLDWKLPDGSRQVIYGDLRTKDVSAEKSKPSGTREPSVAK